MPCNKDMEARKAIVRKSQQKRRERLKANGQQEAHLTKEWRLDRKKQLVDRRGGQCARCGFKPQSDIEYNALDFNHREPTTKSFNISHSFSRKWETLLAEADKCDILCANCHRIEESSYSLGGRPRQT